MDRGLVLLAVVVLTLLGWRFYNYYGNMPSLSDGQTLNFEATILSQPQTAGGRQTFFAIYEKQKVRMVAESFPEINYRDSIEILGKTSNKDYGVLMYFPKIKKLMPRKYLTKKVLRG